MEGFKKISDDLEGVIEKDDSNSSTTTESEDGKQVMGKNGSFCTFVSLPLPLGINYNHIYNVDSYFVLTDPTYVQRKTLPSITHKQVPDCRGNACCH